ncbi:MAG TPA: acyl-CoA thioesterase [Nevskiaceae bacterium]|nr:acyl-CoA thioesterase [Nevskiaceae bacterium]
MSESGFDWDVARPFTERVRVGDGDLDRFAHTNNVTYLAWLERVAWSHSKSLGLDFDDYERLGAGCVARRHELDYLLPTFKGDELVLGTWVDECDAKFTMWRAYQIIRVADGKTVLRGRTRWVCIDMGSGKLKRMPPEFVAAYRPVPVSERRDARQQVAK